MPMPGKMGGFGYDDAQVRRAPADAVNFRIPAPPAARAQLFGPSDTTPDGTHA